MESCDFVFDGNIYRVNSADIPIRKKIYLPHLGKNLTIWSVKKNLPPVVEDYCISPMAYTKYTGQKIS